MKKLFSLALAGMACLALAAPASATAVFGPLTYAPNAKLISVANMAAADYTNATTGLTDIAEATVAVPAASGDFSKRYLRVCFSASASKATSTTGTIRVYVNGAAVTASGATIDFAALGGHLSSCYTVARADAAAQTVKLQGVSGDTAVFTVSELQMEVWEITLN